MSSILTVIIIQTPEFELESVADTLNNIFLIFPNYALGMGIVQLSVNYQFAKDCAMNNLEFLCPVAPDSYCCAKCMIFLLLWICAQFAGIVNFSSFGNLVKSNFLDWERGGIGKNIAGLSSAFVIYFIVLFIYESRVWIKFRKWRNLKTKPVGNSSTDKVDGDGMKGFWIFNYQNLKKNVWPTYMLQMVRA